MNQQVNLDTEYIQSQVKEILTIVDWGLVEHIYVSGSFANTGKKVDSNGYSDIDIELIITDFEEWFDVQQDVSCYDGMNPQSIHVTAENGTIDYGERKIDLIVGSSTPEDIDLIEIY